MTHADRIEELEKKFGENPRRYFAPLANEYRKAGDLARAIEICRSHLPQQPGHMSGHIVYGQALYESRKLDEAKGVFEAALGLDPENLIALRHLGDIARDSGDPQTARLWYLRVLDADPRNDEVAGMLAELDAAGAGAAPSDGGAMGWGDINPERGGGAAAPPASAGTGVDDSLTVEHASAGGESFLASLTGSPAESPAAPAGEDPLAQDPMWDTGADQIPPRSQRPTPVAPIEAGPPPAPPSAAASGREVDANTFAEVDALFDEIATPAAGEPAESARRSHTASTKPLDIQHERPAADQGEPVAVPKVPGLEASEFAPPPRDPSPRIAPGAVPGLTSFGADDRQDSAPPAAFVTETMAELYLQQGFTAEALEIYQRLLAQNPNDLSLRDRVAQLEAGGQSSMSVAAVSSEVIAAARQRQSVRPVRTVRSFFGLLAGRRAPRQGGEVGDFPPPVPEPPPPPQRKPTPSEPPRRNPTPAGARDGLTGLFGAGGVSVEDEEAATLLAAAFGPSPGEEAGDNAGRGSASQNSGRPARAAGEELSLDDVFRESSSRAQRKSGAYSFDQFFSPNASEAAPPGSGSEGAAADEEGPPGEDLEQFTAWLEGLKRK